MAGKKLSAVRAAQAARFDSKKPDDPMWVDSFESFGQVSKLRTRGIACSTSNLDRCLISEDWISAAQWNPLSASRDAWPGWTQQRGISFDGLAAPCDRLISALLADESLV